ncbi:MAG TPA: radical SAM family heme chaperone HemW [Vicinamibacterales bacterium]|nr:radical SAM family heme chaperone HemW [Vicinamibacterales bacterium]
MLGLYVHIPFCSAICNYCNFNRGLFDADLKRRYLGALLTEIGRKADGSPADTIFFGGGTPSLLEPSEVQSIVGECRNSFALAPAAEITLEANPETVTRDRLRAFRDAGINRLSFGVQSFRDEELQRLSRLHSAARACEAFEMAREAGFDNISLDLMMWLPQQSVAEWFSSIDALIGLGPEHASLYLLEIYPNAPLKDTMARSRWSLAPDDDAAEMYLGAMSRLDDAGYTQYEISNVSKPGLESRHNLKYWSDGEWLGFGCGAHSTRRGIREKNVASTEDYVSAIVAGRSVETERRVLSGQERLEEATFTALRLTQGVNLEIVRSRYGVDLWERHGEELAPFVEQGLLIYDGGSIRLTRDGMLLANEVMAVFIGPPVR